MAMMKIYVEFDNDQFIQVAQIHNEKNLNKRTYSKENDVIITLP